MPSSDLISVDDYLAWPKRTASARVPYGELDQQFGDLYLPQNDGPHPVVVMIHGGCWRAKYDLTPLGELCEALTAAGLAVWSIEYRRLGSGGGWPGTFMDVAGAVDFVRTLADRYPLDLTRVVAAGHSAGGHLACWVAGRRNLFPDSPLYAADPLPLRGVLALAGIPDLVTGVEQEICGEACQELVGGLPADLPGRYAQASPRELLPFGIPQIHIVGDQDPTIPVPYLQEYTAVAGGVDPTTLTILPQAGHFEIVSPHTFAWPTVRDALIQLTTGQ